MPLLSTTTINGVSSQTISIPAGYQTASIKVSGKSDYGCGLVSLGLQVNGDNTHALYYWTWNENRACPGDPGAINVPASGEGGEARIRVGLWPGAQRVCGYASSPAGFQNGVQDPCNGLWYDSAHPPAPTGAPNAIGSAGITIYQYNQVGPLKPVEFTSSLWNGAYNNLSSISGSGIYNDQATPGTAPAISSFTLLLDVGNFVNTVACLYGD